MPRGRHENPYAERRIRELGLPGRPTRSELEQDARREAARAKRAAALHAIDWAGMSPAELAFRWMLERYRADKPCDYAEWARETRIAWKQRRDGGH